jgi:uncharacterized protein YqjF (DUF2071 family)
MYQKWRDLLFLHWAFEPDVVQRTLPAGLTVDTHDGRAYVGLVPFLMRDIRPRFLPTVRGISDFLEVNVRTYVYDSSGVPGVWFYSLDANQSLAVLLARTLFKLPYFRATMRVDDGGGENAIVYRSQRRQTHGETRFVYRGVGALDSAEPGTLAFFLVERYVLFAQGRRGIRSGRVHHAPYQIQAAQVDDWDTRLFTLNDLPEPARQPDHALYSPGVSVDVFPLTAP